MHKMNIGREKARFLRNSMQGSSAPTVTKENGVGSNDPCQKEMGRRGQMHTCGPRKRRQGPNRPLPSLLTRNGAGARGPCRSREGQGPLAPAGFKKEGEAGAKVGPCRAFLGEKWQGPMAPAKALIDRREGRGQRPLPSPFSKGGSRGHLAPAG